jgi:hypothetical protein
LQTIRVVTKSIEDVHKTFDRVSLDSTVWDILRLKLESLSVVLLVNVVGGLNSEHTNCLVLRTADETCSNILKVLGVIDKMSGTVVINIVEGSFVEAFCGDSRSVEIGKVSAVGTALHHVGAVDLGGLDDLDGVAELAACTVARDRHSRSITTERLQSLDTIVIKGWELVK